ncbi:MAG: hypothetical protein WCI11_09600 [Candidatus Methylumidiphilus sp.]
MFCVNGISAWSVKACFDRLSQTGRGNSNSHYGSIAVIPASMPE